jgi:hypothetical protein
LKDEQISNSTLFTLETMLIAILAKRGMIFAAIIDSNTFGIIEDSEIGR